MKLYLVEFTEKVGYDMYDAMVVRADNNTEASAFAAEASGINGKGLWLATEINETGEAGIVLASFNAG